MPDAPQEVLDRSVVEHLNYEQNPYAGNFTLWLASVADDILPWGGGWTQFQTRDVQLRQFYQKEPMLASALYAIIIRDGALSWTLRGDAPRTIRAVQEMMHNANFGAGWLDFITKWATDFRTQDNGAFIELVRKADNPESPVIGINHLDAGQCRRTGVQEWPVIYTDRLGRQHKLYWYQVIATADWSSPIESVNGLGFCAVSRVLRQAQLMRDIGVRDRERASGMDPKSLHVVSGVNREEIQEVMQSHRDQQQQQGYVRYSKPVIFTTLDPQSPASVSSIDLAPKPSDVSIEEQYRWYITLLAMAIGCDYQDLAPMPTQGIGGSQQSLILHQKSRGRGPALFMKTVEHIFQFHGVIPRNVEFAYDERDMEGEAAHAQILKVAAETYGLFVSAGVLQPQSVRNELLDAGLISREVFEVEAAGQEDITDETVAVDDEQADDGETPNDAPVADKALNPRDVRERTAWEESMAGDIAKRFRQLHRDLKARWLPEKKSWFREGKKELPAETLVDPEWWREFRLTMTEAMLPNARAIFLGAGVYNERLGLVVNMDAINLEVLDFSRTYTTEWLNALEETTRDGLRRAIVTWQESGLGERGLLDLVDSISPFFDEARAARIAATETTRVFDLGNVAAHRSAGIEYEQWLTSMDDKVRPEHRALEGRVFRIDEGPRPSDYPFGVNCRCTRAAIATDEALRLLGGRI